jgi:uncharacterized protein YbjT (DUF2867 family)
VHAIAWQAQVRLCARYRRLIAIGKKPPVVIGSVRPSNLRYLYTNGWITDSQRSDITSKLKPILTIMRGERLIGTFTPTSRLNNCGGESGMPAVTVFGGSGFLGRHIVERLAASGADVRTAVRRPQHVGIPEEVAPGRIIAMRADVRDEESVAKAVVGASAVVNAVSAYVEKRGVTFSAVHEEGALKVARQATRYGVGTLVHISGIGADPASASHYIRARGRGELTVKEAFPMATILRPSAMFGPAEGIFGTFAAVARSSPFFPMIGDGRTELQPVHVRDVAMATARALEKPHARGRAFELGGPRIYTLKECVELVLHQLGLQRVCVPIPFAVAELLAALLERLPNPPLTVGMIDLLRRDNVVSPTAPQFVDLGITPISVEEALPSLLDRPRANSEQRPKTN